MTDKNNQPIGGTSLPNGESFSDSFSSSSDFVEPGAFTSTWSDVVLLQSRSRNLIYTGVRYGRRFLLKTLRPEFANLTDYRLLHEKEFRLGFSLNHPNIASTYSFEEISLPVTIIDDKHPNGDHPLPGSVRPLTEESRREAYLCIVQEYVDGVSLGEWLTTNPSYDIRKRVFMQMLDALEYLHNRQLVHHDLKSGNLLVTRNGQNLKLIDFGLSDTDDSLAPGSNDPRDDIRRLVPLMQLLFPHKYSLVRRNANLGKYSNIAALRRAVNKRDELSKIVLISVLSVLLLLSLGFLLVSQYLHSREQAAESSSRSLMNERINSLLDDEKQRLERWLVAYPVYNEEAHLAFMRITYDSSVAYDSISAWYAIDDPLYTDASTIYTHRVGRMRSEYRAIADSRTRNISANDALMSGICGAAGDNLLWELRSDTLLISGNGLMVDFPTYDAAPWVPHKDNIRYIVIQEGVTSVGNYAFWRSENLLNVDIPSSLTYIGQNSFEDCISLQSVIVPENVTYIGYGAFHKCLSMTYVEWRAIDSRFNNLPSNHSPIFCECFKLKKLVIGADVVSLPESICDYVDYLSIVCMAVTPPSLPYESFARVYQHNAKLYVPKQSIKAYSKAANWSLFTDIQPKD